MILITGATGYLGNATVKYLLSETDPKGLGVMARNPEQLDDLKSRGVTVRKGDYDDYKSLVAAFNGVDKLYFVSGTDVQKRFQQHENVVKAAVEAGVKHVVYTSFQRRNESDTSPVAIVVKAHLVTEQMLKESGLNYTFMKHNLYADNIPMFIGEQVLEMGTIFLPAGEGRAAYATRSNMAEAGARILLGSGHENKSYEIANTESVSYGEIAEMLGSISGKEIKYVSPSVEEFSEQLKKVGVPEAIIGMSIGFSTAILQGEFDLPDNTLAEILGRKSDSMLDYLKSVYAV